MIRAWALGIAILLVADSAWLLCLQASDLSKVLAPLLWGSPAVAAFVSAYLAPSKKLLVGALMAVPAAILVGAFNSLYEVFGSAVDFPGLGGGLILVVVTLMWTWIPCILGGAAGYFLAIKQVQQA